MPISPVVCAWTAAPRQRQTMLTVLAFPNIRPPRSQIVTPRKTHLQKLDETMTFVKRSKRGHPGYDARNSGRRHDAPGNGSQLLLLLLSAPGLRGGRSGRR